jgi:hypothetical protein
MRTKTRGVLFAVAAVVVLLAGCGLAILLPAACPLCVGVGFLGYVACGGRAVALWRLDDRVFDLPHRHVPPRSALRAIACLALAAAALPLRAQQTIFNVPSADVLDPGKVYLETDELFRPTDPQFSSTTVRGVVGVFPRVEAGVNFGGLVSPGPVVPTATVAVKAQPLNAGGFSLTAGGHGLFFLRGAQDGDPSGFGYAHAAYKVSGLGTRVAFGGWYASAGYAKPGSTGGVLASLEQPLPWVKGLTLAADWFSGVNSIGYFSPGLVYTTGPWALYAAYTRKNGDSRGDGGLVELGYAF